MKARAIASLAACLLLVGSGRCLGMMEIEQVTPVRARELGITVLAKPAGPDLVRVELSFPTAGPMKDFRRVDLYISEAGKSVLEVSLLAEQTKPGEILASFAADQARIEKTTFRIVTGVGRSMVGHDLRAKDFVELKAR